MADYEIPPFGTSGDRLLGWLMDAVSQGQAWLDAQRPTTEWQGVIDALGANSTQVHVDGLSNTGYALVERNARDIVASLSNFKHEGEFKPRWDKALYDPAHVLTKLDRNCYTETGMSEAIRQNLQYTVAKGTGYLYQDYDKDFWGTHGDVRLRAIDPGDVTFLQLPADHNIQKAYAVIIREEMPINLAKATYESIAHLMEPDRDSPGWLMRGIRAAQKFMGGSPALRVGGQSKKTTSFPTVDVFHMYTRDIRINLGSGPVTMGEANANWRYTVPALGDPMPTGQKNPATGQMFTRPAEKLDARLFPLRRYSVFTRTAVAYDGTSPWWHGDVPLARLRFNDWAWEALGRSILADPRTMEQGIIALMRYIEDACAARLDPPYLYDDVLTSKGFADNFNPRKAGSRAQVSLNAGEYIKIPVDVQHYDVPQAIPDWVKAQEERINKQMGTPDLIAISKARQVPSSDAQEKLLEMAGPLVQDMMRAQVLPQRQLGEWRKAYYFQFYTRGRIIQVTGPDDDSGETEDYEYTPDKIVPVIEGEALATKIERTKRYLHEFKYTVTRSGINEMFRMTQKLAMLQLKKAIPVDRWTVADMWEIPNYGPKPQGTHNVMERVIAEAHMDRELQEELGGGQVGPGAGRPQSGKKAPALASKDGGTRTTVKTS